MQIINISGLARGSSALVVWPLVDGTGAPLAGVTSARLTVNGSPQLVLTLGAGLSFAAGELSADLTAERTAALRSPVPYELWVQIGADKLAAVGGVLEFTNTFGGV